MFKNPISPKKKEDGDRPWDFEAPQYDMRSSCFVQAGCDYGTGFKQPMGGFSVAAKSNIPQKAMRIDINAEQEKASY